MLKALSYILCDLDPKVKVIGQKAGICDGVPSTSALVSICEESKLFLVNGNVSFVIYFITSSEFNAYQM